MDMISDHIKNKLVGCIFFAPFFALGFKLLKAQRQLYAKYAGKNHTFGIVNVFCHT